MQGFNVTIIQPPGYPHSQALGEVWIYLAEVLARSGYAARASINSFSATEHNVLLCGHLLRAEHVGMVPSNTIIFNSEKLEQGDGWYLQNGVYARLLERHAVWDYSARNIAHVRHAMTAQIPFYMSDALKKSHPRNSDGPVLFYGCITERRKDILQRLQQAGIATAVAPFGCYGDARDKLMYQARAVLNLHTDDERKVFEPVRCFHPLINGIPVITEDFHDEPMFDIYRRSTFVVGADPVGEIVNLLSDPQAFDAAAHLRCMTFAASDPLPDVRRAAASYLSWHEQGQPIAANAT